MSFELTVLGTSSGLPTSKRFPTAHVLNVHERFFLIDCGEGTQIRLRQFKIHFQRINHIFISHLHGDHYYGIFGLLSTFNMLGRATDLHIYSPPELQKKVEFQMYPEEFKFKIIYHPHNFEKPETIFENKNMFVRSFPLQHRIKTCGFLFKEKKKDKNILKEAIEKYKFSIKDIVLIKKGNDFVTENGKFIPNSEITLPQPVSHSYAFCSDTKYYEEIISEIENVDLLYHEATFTHNDAQIARTTGHSTAREAAMTAKKANAKKLVIGHFSARYASAEILEKDARVEFENTVAANDGDIFDIELDTILKVKDKN
jgi:ribonuclease Z